MKQKTDTLSLLTIAGFALAFVIIGTFILSKIHSGMKFPVKGKITSNYGNRIHPISGANKFHNGIDIAAPTGTPVEAPSSGTVVKTWSDSLNGNAISIKHTNGYTTGYAHLSKINVEKGQKVKTGQIIGLVGTTGASTGPHLHLTIRNSAGATVDPKTVLS